MTATLLHWWRLLTEPRGGNIVTTQPRRWQVRYPCGGVLPTRPVAAPAFATAKDQFESVWHWTADEYGGSDAWGQSFHLGTQDNGHKFDELRARAVRLIQLTA